MTMLPASTDFTGATKTEAEFKTAITALRTFLFEKLGDDGSVAVQAFATGTKMLFQQTAAPTGWTKDTTHNDKALRVVSGTASSGGTTAFSTVLGGSTGAHTLTAAQMPSHTHAELIQGAAAMRLAGQSSPMIGSSGVGEPGYPEITGATGSGGSHSHSIAVQYVDVIIATKD